METIAVKERPILFSGAMVRAIIEGRKTQTRRIVKNLPEGHGACACGYAGGWAVEKPDTSCTCKPLVCPFGKPGDRLYVRETWKPDVQDDISGYRYAADGAFISIENTQAAADLWLEARRPEEQWPEMKKPKWRPSIHMPRRASRILIEVTDVRVERLQEISEEDARAEGVEPNCDGDTDTCCLHCQQTGECQSKGEFIHYGTDEDGDPAYSARESFQSLWESINGEDSWKANPWVWVVSFKALKAVGEGVGA